MHFHTKPTLGSNTGGKKMDTTLHLPLTSYSVIIFVITCKTLPLNLNKIYLVFSLADPPKKIM